MQICLINPRYPIGVNNNPPLGLAYIAAVVKENGFSIKIVDDEIQRLTDKQWQDKIRGISPDIVGITATTPTINEANRIAKIVKENSNATVALGGPHSTALAESCLQSKEIDVVVIGEGEYSFLEIVRCIEKKEQLSKIKGIAYKRNGEILLTSPRETVLIDNLPFPTRELLDMETYIKRNSQASAVMFVDVLPIFSKRIFRVTEIFVGRGCPYNCIYCAGKVALGRKLRLRSPKNVIEEMKLLKEDYQINGVYIQDDTPTISKKWMIEFCELLIEENLPIWWASNARAENLDDEVMGYMKKARCCCLGIGVESHSQQHLEILKRGSTVEAVKKGFALCRKYDIRAFGYFMYNIPGETYKEMQETLEFVYLLRPDVAQFAILTPFPGTEIFREKVNKSTDLWDKYLYMDDVAYNFTKDISDKKLVEFLKYSYRKYGDFLLLHPNKQVFRLIWYRLLRNPRATLERIAVAFSPGLYYFIYRLLKRLKIYIKKTIWKS